MKVEFNGSGFSASMNEDCERKSRGVNKAETFVQAYLGFTLGCVANALIILAILANVFLRLGAVLLSKAPYYEHIGVEGYIGYFGVVAAVMSVIMLLGAVICGIVSIIICEKQKNNNQFTRIGETLSMIALCACKLILIFGVWFALVMNLVSL